MPLKNRIKEFIDSKGITRYQFCKDTGLTRTLGIGYTTSLTTSLERRFAQNHKAYKISQGFLVSTSRKMMAIRMLLPNKRILVSQDRKSI